VVAMVEWVGVSDVSTAGLGLRPLLQSACSGPAYLVRSLSWCPRSQGSLGVMGWWQRAQWTVPVATAGSRVARRCSWWVS
jgi:hypothetical protein